MNIAARELGFLNVDGWSLSVTSGSSSVSGSGLYLWPVSKAATLGQPPSAHQSLGLL